MGGHGGLNILPQKRWNVYRYDNREKVRKDEEAAAKEEQLKREQARKRDTEFRLEQLRASRGIEPITKPEAQSDEPTMPTTEAKPKSNNHINLFEGIKIFDPIKAMENDRDAKQDEPKKKKMKKEEVRVVTEEDEKYRLGYGVAGKGVKLPWYLEKKSNDEDTVNTASSSGKEEKICAKKTLEQLREERLAREKKEKERERKLVMEKSGTRREGAFPKDNGYSRGYTAGFYRR